MLEEIKKLAKLKVGNAATSDTIAAITGKDTWDQPDTAYLLQADDTCASETIGKTRLFETFTRDGLDDAWIYAGLCERGSCVNRSPAEARKVFICSPYALNPLWSVKFARAACYAAFTDGCLPIAPHLYFTRFLHEGGDGFEREYGIAAGHELMKLCDEIVVYEIRGYVSSGMRADIEFAVNQLAMQPKVIKMSQKEANEFIETYLKDAEEFQGLDPAEE